MKKTLIVTTINDASIWLFLSQKNQNITDMDFFFLHEKDWELEKLLKENEYDYIYVRDPFNHIFEEDNVSKKMGYILEYKKNAYMIDNISKIEDIYFEDKWIQYWDFSEFMPKTQLLNKNNYIKNTIIKKRISSRAKWIYFDLKDLPKDYLSEDYVIQDMKKVDKEYRIYALFWKVLRNAAARTPKTINSKVKIIWVEELNEWIYDFSQNIIDHCKYDCVWLDIIQSWEKYYLLEINRSPLFNWYFNSSNINLTENLIELLLLEK